MSYRPSDWSPVGLDVDPTPGDPVLVLAGGQDYLEVAGAINDAASAMSRLDVDGTVSQAVDALMEKKEDTISEIRRAHGRYEAAGEALIDYSSALERVQQETLTALEQARTAQTEQETAARQADSFQDLADSTTDDEQKREYEQKASEYSGNATTAAGIVSSARSTVEDAVADRNTAADNAISRIEEITSNDDLNDGWWENWGSKLVAAIADIADLVSTIAGILAIVAAFIPIIGPAIAGALIVIAAVAAIVSALANITLAATGERSWAEAGLAIAGAALSLIGLGGAAKAAMGLSKVLATTAGKQALKQSLKGFSGGLKSNLKKLYCKFRFGACFVAGTLIHTVDGDKPIEEIRVGDKVWARDLTSGRDELRLVNETFVKQAATLYHLNIAGSTVTTTAEHPFMVYGIGWLDAQDLTLGARIVTTEGTATLEGIEVEQRSTDDVETVYNFHVDGHHNYYVVAGTSAVLVHNVNGVGEVFRDGKYRFQIFSNDHGPAHGHLFGPGLDKAHGVQIGQNGKPLKPNVVLDRRAQEVINNNLQTIRKSIKKSMKIHKLNSGC
ncbi:polymorphic toxin-type HINT domain-containing protein [Myceligenerans indicum]|uniref:Hint domain-containing protein n=1 Tax=Myceligenerans indicum TaxID=2593663 RepID=A0ABS1LGV0_9MICO|nr:polymorphic toxin-type HINT domain-containing protein [Myceligenerans indicum]MBL0885431.1 hypothetical protein [Myceligenerans indicum]